MSTQLLTLSDMGQSGLNSDIAAWELGPEFMTYGDNFRIRDGSLLPFSGSVKMLDPPVEAGEIHAGTFKHVRIKYGDYWLMGTRTSLWATGGPSGWHDASNKDYALSEDGEFDWTFDQLAQVVVVNNPESYPEYWVGPNKGLQFIGLPFSPTQTWEEAGHKCRSLRVFRNFMFAMNLSGAEEAPNGYRISHPADIDGIPFTWDPAPLGSIAVRGQLGGDGAMIIDGLALRDSFIMYSRDSIDVFTYNPNSEFYWSRSELSNSVGLLAINCLVEHKGIHYFISGGGDIIRNDGTNLVSLIHNRIAHRFNARVNTEALRKSFVCKQDKLKEIWFCVPEGTSETPNTAYAYNWVDDSWAIRDLPTGAVFCDFGYNPLEGEPEAYGRWSLIQGGWTSQIRSWGNAAVGTLFSVMGGITSDGTMHDFDPLGDIDQAELGSVLERTDYPLSGHRQMNTVSRIYPHASGDPFDIEIGSQDQVGGPIRWELKKRFDPGNQRKIDVRTTGEAFAWRISSVGKNRFKLSGMDFEYTPAGLR